MSHSTRSMAAPYFHRIGSIVVLLSFPACSCIHLPKHCCKPKTPVEDKKTLLYGDEASQQKPSFKTVFMEGGGRRWKVFVIGNPSSPPVVLLHEIPALSPGALKLAVRLSDKFRVYVPLLFGGELDDNNSTFLQSSRVLQMAFFRPSWNAMRSGERKITRDLSGLCRTIVKEHGPQARLGVIGMCITGAIPLQLLGENNPIPQLKGIVLSQPTMPVQTCTIAEKKSLGISDAELERAKAHVKAENLRILGFRFEGDEVSPGERFARLKDEFRAHFLDRTLKKRDYIDDDHMPPEAHAVLTDGYCPPQPDPLHPSEPAHSPPSAGQRAYAQLRDYLIETLKPVR
jgi:dienelactone hydrolase